MLPFATNPQALLSKDGRLSITTAVTELEKTSHRRRHLPCFVLRRWRRPQMRKHCQRLTHLTLSATLGQYTRIQSTRSSAPNPRHLALAVHRNPLQLYLCTLPTKIHWRFLELQPEGVQNHPTEPRHAPPAVWANEIFLERGCAMSMRMARFVESSLMGSQ